MPQFYGTDRPSARSSRFRLDRPVAHKATGHHCQAAIDIGRVRGSERRLLPEHTPPRTSASRESVAREVQRAARHVHDLVDGEDHRDAGLAREAEGRAHVPAMITRVARGTPATPFDGEHEREAPSRSCVDSGMSTFAACAIVIDASTR